MRSTHLNMHLCCCCFCFVTASFRAGKANIATVSPRLFACQRISFATPFYGGEEITVLATVGRSIKSPTRGNGGAIWVESVDNSGFKACILEYSDGSNNTAEVNWIAIQSAPSGAKKGTASLNDSGPARGGSGIPIYPLFCPQDTNIPQNRKMCDTKYLKLF